VLPELNNLHTTAAALSAGGLVARLGERGAHPQTQRVPLRCAPARSHSNRRHASGDVNLDANHPLDAATGLFRCAGAGNAAYLSCRQLHNLLATAACHARQPPIRTDSVERLGQQRHDGHAPALVIARPWPQTA